MKKKILLTIAHPDDEAFGPSGTIVKYSSLGAIVHILCATRGEQGELDKEYSENNNLKNKNISEIRTNELLRSSQILGVEKVDFMGFTDGNLSNNQYHKISDIITRKINSFQPDIVITGERLGVSGHLDHIAITMTTTYAFQNTKWGKKLYYFALTKEMVNRIRDKYFIYFPEGYEKKEITTVIDHQKYYDMKIKSIQAHQSQGHDVRRLLRYYESLSKEDNFILHIDRTKSVLKKLETDLFERL